MRAFKTKAFAKWARSQGVSDNVLATAVAEMERGLIDAQLGGQVIKKRVRLPGRGKSGSTRTLVAFRRRRKAFFVGGFAKSEHANISDLELKALKLLAKQLLSYSAAELAIATAARELVEIEVRNDA
jgi:hypothetical protein